MRVFLDANILFSAAKSEGAVRRLLTLLLDAGHELYADGYVVAEAERNLSAKFPASLPKLEALLQRCHVAPGASMIKAFPEAAHVLPEKDRPVLAAAICHNCAALVTGDRAHFGSLYGLTLEGVTIYSPAALAEALL